ncbi:hypothetical protein AMJ98_PC00112 (plasmid) [Rhizobium sp. N1341]|nr:hypothetical protein AMJ98_PC00112 [Rhizobium sp. N1341]ANM37150.1 hypothetical protein AMK04_PB00112 [Rhizobium sp. N871]ANM43307.1 hypothetical protein AMK03_PC00111 [Rhizobium sp. N741]
MAMLFLKFAQQRQFKIMASGADIYCIAATSEFAEPPMDTRTKANARFGYSDEQNRTRNIGRNLTCKEVEYISHDRRADRQESTKNLGNKQKRAVRVDSLPEAEHLDGGYKASIHVNRDSAVGELRRVC